MEKPIVFISHITEEAELALKLKDLIESSFLGMIEVFVSSDETSISAGARWLDNITESLSNCSIELILCSPKSVTRPWINFEAGAGWVRNIPVIPLCHSGMEPAKLPVPLNLLQAAKVSEISSLKLIFPVLGQAIGAKTPNIDFSDFVDSVISFERKYMLGENIKKFFSITNGDMAVLFNHIDTYTQYTTISLDLGFIENEKINEMKTLANNELKDFVSISTKNAGISFFDTGAINGAEVTAFIKDLNMLKQFRGMLL